MVNLWSTYRQYIEKRRVVKHVYKVVLFTFVNIRDKIPLITE